MTITKEQVVAAVLGVDIPISQIEAGAVLKIGPRGADIIAEAIMPLVPQIKKVNVPCRQCGVPRLISTRGKGLADAKAATCWACAKVNLSLKKKWTPTQQQVKYMRAAVEDGRLVKDMASYLGKGRKTVGRELKALGLKTAKPVMDITPIAQSYMAGAGTIKGLAIKFRVCHTRLRRKIVELGGVINSRGRPAA